MCPLIIIVPSPFRFESTKIFRWNYDSVVYIHGQKLEDKPLVIKEIVVNIAGTRVMTRSSRMFVSTPPLKKNNVEGLDKGKRK